MANSKDTRDTNLGSIKIDVRDALTKGGFYAFQPVVGGAIKNPFVVVQHYQAGMPHLNFWKAIKDIYAGPRGALEFGRGYFAHLAKVFPTNFVCTAFVNNYKAQEGYEPSTRNDLTMGAKAAALESFGGAYQEGLEFSKRITPAAEASTLRRVAATAALSWPRNTPYWAGAAMAGRVAGDIKEEHGGTAANIFKLGSSIFIALITTPGHVITGQGWSHASINVPRLIGGVLSTAGPGGLIAGAAARVGVIGISAFLNTTVFEKLDERAKRKPPYDPENYTVIITPEDFSSWTGFLAKSMGPDSSFCDEASRHK
jgi:hypothetical protein